MATNTDLRNDIENLRREKLTQRGIRHELVRVPYAYCLNFPEILHWACGGGLSHHLYFSAQLPVLSCAWLSADVLRIFACATSDELTV